MPEPTTGDLERWLLRRGMTLSEYERMPWVRRDFLYSEFGREWGEDPPQRLPRKFPLIERPAPVIDFLKERPTLILEEPIVKKLNPLSPQVIGQEWIEHGVYAEAVRARIDAKDLELKGYETKLEGPDKYGAYRLYKRRKPPSKQESSGRHEEIVYKYKVFRLFGDFGPEDLVFDSEEEAKKWIAGVRAFRPDLNFEVKKVQGRYVRKWQRVGIFTGRAVSAWVWEPLRE